MPSRRRILLVVGAAVLYVLGAAVHWTLPLAAQRWAALGAQLTPATALVVELDNWMIRWGPMLWWSALCVVFFWLARRPAGRLPRLSRDPGSGAMAAGTVPIVPLPTDVLRWFRCGPEKGPLVPARHLALLALSIGAVLLLGHLFQGDLWLALAWTAGAPAAVGLLALVAGSFYRRRRSARPVRTGMRAAVATGLWIGVGTAILGGLSLTIALLISLPLLRLDTDPLLASYGAPVGRGFASIVVTVAPSMVDRPPLSVLPLLWVVSAVLGMLLVVVDAVDADPNGAASSGDGWVERVRGLRKRTAHSRAGGAMLLLLFAAACFGLLPGVITSQAFASLVKGRSLRGDSVILWLRRFHRTEPRNRGLARLLSEASETLGISLTLRDRSFRTSQLASTFRLKAAAPVVVGAVTLVLFAIAAIFEANRALAIGLLVTALVAGGGLFRRLGFVRLRKKSAPSRAARIGEDIRHRRGLFTDIVVLRCEDESWQEVVGAALGTCDVALFDVRDITDNLLWELERATSLIEPERLLFVHGNAGIPDALEERLGSVFGDSWRSRVRVLEYPEEWPRGRAAKKLRKQTIRQLAEALGECLLSAQQREATRDGISGPAPQPAA